MAQPILVTVTAPNEEVAVSLARAAVEQRLAAGGNVVRGLRSIYRWKDQLFDEAEVMILFQTTDERFEALRALLVSLHPYECPEIIATPITQGHPPYLAWIHENTG